MTANPFNPSTSGLQPTAGNSGTPGAITAISSSTNIISLGTLSFTIPPQAAFAPGMFVSVVDANDNSNWMWGTVENYSGTTLNIDVQQINGSGTKSSWLINLSGATGQTGATGATGAMGADGTSAGTLSGFVQGLKITNHSGTPNTKIDITAVLATMVTSAGLSITSSASLTIDLTAGTSTSTANGMDGESRGTSSWLYLYLISNGGAAAGLASKTSPLSSNPTLPSGYNYSTYVGAVRVDGSGNLLRTQQLGEHASYIVTASSNTAVLPAIASGLAGDPSVPTWVGVSVSNFVPNTASGVLVAVNSAVGNSADNVIVAPNNSYGTAVSTNPPPIANDIANASSISLLPLESTNIYWASQGADGYILCVGWNDYVVTT